MFFHFINLKLLSPGGVIKHEIQNCCKFSFSLCKGVFIEGECITDRVAVAVFIQLLFLASFFPNLCIWNIVNKMQDRQS